MHTKYCTIPISRIWPLNVCVGGDGDINLLSVSVWSSEIWCRTGIKKEFSIKLSFLVWRGWDQHMSDSIQSILLWGNYKDLTVWYSWHSELTWTKTALVSMRGWYGLSVWPLNVCVGGDINLLSGNMSADVVPSVGGHNVSCTKWYPGPAVQCSTAVLVLLQLQSRHASRSAWPGLTAPYHISHSLSLAW